MNELGDWLVIGALLFGLICVLRRIDRLEERIAEMEKKREPGEE